MGDFFRFRLNSRGRVDRGRGRFCFGGLATEGRGAFLEGSGFRGGDGGLRGCPVGGRVEHGLFGCSGWREKIIHD